jgi:type I restriction enzyme S subunit
VNGKFEVHQRVYKISDFKDGVLGKFIYLKMLFSFYNHAMTNSVKATVDSLRLPTFLEFIITLPPTIEEQKAIAQILSDMDRELDELEIKKEKYEHIKQGMMQELLTGKTRLI